jgi:hypothetical protein
LKPTRFQTVIILSVNILSIKFFIYNEIRSELSSAADKKACQTPCLPGERAEGVWQASLGVDNVKRFESLEKR